MYQSISYIFLSTGRIDGVYITFSCRKTSKCVTSTCECRGNSLHCTNLCKRGACQNEGNVKNEEWNYSDIDSDDEDALTI